MMAALDDLHARLQFDAERRRDMRRAIDLIVALLDATEGATLQRRWERVEAVRAVGATGRAAGAPRPRRRRL
jgi:hypothetical protein